MRRFVVALVCALALGSCAGTHERLAANAVGAASELRPDLRVEPLGDGVWLHVSTFPFPGFGDVPSNGLVVVGAEGVLLVDTPWTPEQTVALAQWIERSFGRPVSDVVITHAHQDRTGGIAALPPEARLHAREATVRSSTGLGRPFEAALLPDAASLQLAGGRVETFFPGAGHTEDNIVVWLPGRRLLFGGCFVKGAEADHLGNVADADVASWGPAVQRVMERYPDAGVVVPGHGAVAGPELLRHTARLIELHP